MKYLFVIIALFIFSFTVSAQDPEMSDEVKIVQDFEAKLMETERIDIQPEVPEIETKIKPQSYFIPSIPLDVKYLPPKIKPLAMKRHKLPESYKGHIKLGAGLPLGFYGDASYYAFIQKMVRLKFHAGHHSTNLKSIENQAFMKNNIGVNGTYYNKNGFGVNGMLNYSSDKFHFYGYNFDNKIDTTGINKADVAQQFSLVDFSTNIFNSHKTMADFNYNAGINFYFLSDNYASAEKGFDLLLQGTKWIGEKHSIDVILETDFTRFEDTLVQKLNNFYLKPSFTFHGDIFKIKIGGNMVSHNDNYSFFPDAKATVNIVGNQIVAFGGAEGSLQKNDLRTLGAYNPYILTSSITLKNTKYNHYFGGIKGVFSGFEYSGQVGYKKAEDLALFVAVNDPENTIRKTFAVVYDTVTIFNIRGSITAKVLKGLTITGLINQNVYTPTREEKAWHLPSLEVNGRVTYSTLDDKLLLKGELFIENGVPFMNDEGKPDNLNGLFDISVGAEYFLSKNFGLFLDINNLANNQRQRWQYYPTYGLNFIGGISARF